MDLAPRTRTWLSGLAVGAAAILPYLPTLGAGFVFDDVVLVRDSVALRGSLLDLWLGRGVYDYWPLTWSSLWLDLRLFGVDPFVYHLENVLLHAATAVLFWRFLVRLPVRGAWLGAAIFAVHPVAVESVAWVSERKNVLSGVLFVASALAWLHFDESRRRPAWLISVGLFLLALLAKTSVVMLPVVLLLLVLYRRAAVARRDLVPILPYLGLSLALGAVTLWFQATRAVGEQTGAPRDLAERIAASGWALGHYLRTALLPTNLGFIYPEWPVPPDSIVFWLPTIVLSVATVAGTCLWLRTRQRWLLAFAFHAVMVLPVLGLVEIAFFYLAPVANHLQYLALMGPAALAGALATGLLGARLRSAAIPVAAVTVMLLGIRSSSRAAAFESEVTLWEQASREQPGALFPAWKRADGLGFAGRTREALDVLSRVEAVAPDLATRKKAAAIRAFHAHQYQQSVVLALQAWRIRPSYIFQMDLSDLLLRAGQANLAVQLLGPLVEIAPRYVDARLALSKAFMQAGDLGGAATLLRAGLALEPSDTRLTAALTEAEAAGRRSMHR